MRVSGAATTEVSAMSERPASGTATFAMPSAWSIPNKPRVPTAANQPEERSPDTWRRHMGHSLGGRRGDDAGAVASTVVRAGLARWVYDGAASAAACGWQRAATGPGKCLPHGV